jgi:dolichyl-phosphate beta-glucosyltransferase
VIPALVSVIVPAYNEEDCIRSHLKKIVDYLSGRFAQFEIIVVDDGSGDDTRKQVALATNEEPRIRLIPLSRNRGKGSAVREGVLAAQGDAVCFTDADLSTPVETIEIGIDALAENSPVVIASRRHPDSIVCLRQNWAREAMGRLFNRFMRLLVSLPFADTQCGFKCFTRQAAREIFSRARIDGFAFDVEIVVIARRLGYEIKEIPVCWTNSPGSKVRPLRDLSRVMRDLLKIYRNDKTGLYGSPK